MKSRKFLSGCLFGVLISTMSFADHDIVNTRLANLVKNSQYVNWANYISAIWPLKGIQVSQVQRLDGSTTFDVQFASPETNEGCILMVAVGDVDDNETIDLVVDGTTCPIPLPAVTGSN